MNKLLWKDAKIDKPTINDIAVTCTSNGCVVLAMWDGSAWWDIDTGDNFGGVQYFAEFSLPHGWNISDHYYGDCRKGRAGYKQRTCKACKLYERKKGE